MEILWWLMALAILFIFFGGTGSLILAYVTYLISNPIKKGSRLVLALGFLLSGGASYWSCRYAMEGVKLSFLDTTIAIVISLATFIVATCFLRKYPFPKTVFGKH